jgi:hypothetical protein
MRFTLAVLMILHGVAHLPGFAGSWRLATFPDLPYHTRLFAGRVDVGDGGMRLIGTLWLLVALGFVVAAVAAFAGEWWWSGTAFLATLLSLVLCMLEWPATQVGVPVNIGIAVALILGRAFGWL